MSEEQKKSEFEVAEAIKALLEQLPQDKRELAVRWARESVGLSPHAAPPPPAATGEEPRRKSIRDFTTEKQPKSDVQFAVVVAYFHRFEAPEAQRKNFITTEDLQEAARLAVWPRKKQPSVTLNNAIKQGYLDRGERGTYRLNAVGENLVAMALPGAANEAPPRPARVLRKPRAPARAAAGRGTRRGKARKAT